VSIIKSDFFGEIPVRTEMTVLPAVQKKDIVGFTLPGLDPRVRRVSIRDTHRLYGYRSLAVCDELQVDEVEKVNNAGHRVVAAYRT